LEERRLGRIADFFVCEDEAKLTADRLQVIFVCLAA